MVTPHAREAEVVVVITDVAGKARVKDKARATREGMVVAMATGRAKGAMAIKAKARIITATRLTAATITRVATATRGADNNAVKAAVDAMAKGVTRVAATVVIKAISNDATIRAEAISLVLLQTWLLPPCRELMCQGKSSCLHLPAHQHLYNSPLSLVFWNSIPRDMASYAN